MWLSVCADVPKATDNYLFMIYLRHIYSCALRVYFSQEWYGGFFFFFSKGGGVSNVGVLYMGGHSCDLTAPPQHTSLNQDRK